MTTETSKLSFSNVINGSLRNGSETSYGTNPRTGESSWAVPIASREDLTEAVKAASNAFQAWSRTEIKERQQVLLKLADVLMAKKEIMSSIISQETGKSVRALSVFFFFSTVIISQIDSTESGLILEIHERSRS